MTGLNVRKISNKSFIGNLHILSKSYLSQVRKRIFYMQGFFSSYPNDLVIWYYWFQPDHRVNLFNTLTCRLDFSQYKNPQEESTSSSQEKADIEKVRYWYYIQEAIELKTEKSSISVAIWEVGPPCLARFHSDMVIGEIREHVYFLIRVNVKDVFMWSGFYFGPKEMSADEWIFISEWNFIFSI